MNLLWTIITIVIIFPAVWTLIAMAPIHMLSKGCNTKFLQICSDKETNSSTSWITERYVHFRLHLKAYLVNYTLLIKS